MMQNNIGTPIIYSGGFEGVEEHGKDVIRISCFS